MGVRLKSLADQCIPRIAGGEDAPRKPGRPLQRLLPSRMTQASNGWRATSVVAWAPATACAAPHQNTEGEEVARNGVSGAKSSKDSCLNKPSPAATVPGVCDSTEPARSWSVQHHRSDQDNGPIEQDRPVQQHRYVITDRFLFTRFH